MLLVFVMAVIDGHYVGFLSFACSGEQFISVVQFILVVLNQREIVF